MKYFAKGKITRVALITISIILQLGLWIGLIALLQNYSEWSFVISMLLSVAFIAFIMYKEEPSEFKTSWIIFVCFLPITGMFCYAFLSGAVASKRTKERNKKTNERFKTQMKVISDFDVNDITDKTHIKRQIKYLSETAFSPAQVNTATDYYKIGEEFLVALVEELKKAEKFIFLEYFIIDEGKGWKEIEAILIDKASKGVDVRVIYDEVGSLLTITPEFAKNLRKNVIKCEIFNPYKNIINGSYNNRDHRKICVIDGNIGFTGGINLADEYFNNIQKFGHWKDTAIKLKGDAVYNLTVMFLAMWESITKTDENFEKFLPTKSYESDGIIQPFYDNPYDGNAVGETIYMSILNSAYDYVYITSPFLIISGEMMCSLTTAAKSGVDVKIILPAVPDHKIIQFLSRSYYQELINAGVEIYEYTPGYIHAKMFVCDDETAVVGTINLDYRSLTHHYECGVWMYNNSSINDVKIDFLETLKICRLINTDPIEIKGIKKLFHFIAVGVLRIFAPLM